MNKKSVTLLITILFLLTNLSMITTASNSIQTTNKDTIYVDDDNTDGPWYGTLEYPYQHIGDAIENAAEGDTIYVFNGTYYENLLVDKTLLITGENKNTTIIDGMYNEFVIKIIKDAVTIKNFTIRNSGGYKNNAGVKIDAKDNLIIQCIFYRTKTGIYQNTTGNNEINDCTFYTNGEGIYLRSSFESIIKDCRFAHNSIGIHIEHSNQIKITNCYAHTNGIGLFFKNSSYVEISQCAVYNNNDNQGGIFLNFCSNFNILNCNIYHNGFGIKTSHCANINFSYSDFFWNTHSSMQLEQSVNDIVIDHCEFSDNFRFALLFRGSNIIISDSNIHDSLFGIQSEYSQVTAKHNYWGSPFGPALFDRETKDRIFFKFGYIKFFPWHIRKVADAGTNWEIDYDLFPGEVNTSRYVEIELSGTDSDGDGVPNWWEDKWGYDSYSWDDHKHLDPDEDGLNNIEECYADVWDSNPFHKDVFLEFDWVKPQNPNASNKPSYSSICKIKSAFKRHNITLHVDAGKLGGGEEIPPTSNFSYADLRDLYWDYFLHNDLNNPRKGIFHYCLVCDYGAGPGFSFIGWDHLDSFEISAQMLHESFPRYSRDHVIISGAFHEFGHTFGLFVDDHGGNDNRVATKIFTLQWWKYLNYKSIMNYWYTYRILDYSDGSHGKGDFDDWGNLDFSFFKNTHFEWPKEE
jgi:parallel beta-helix repeat protein